MQQRLDETVATTNGHLPAGASPAAQQRVTPEELLEALKALENRQAQMGSAADTISLGEAVQDLNLDLSAEQVWEEVKAQRANAAATAERKAAQAMARRRRRVAIVALIGLLMVPVGMGLLAARPRTVAPVRVASPQQVQPLAAPGYVALSQVAEGEMALVDYDTLNNLASGVKTADTALVRRPDPAFAESAGGLWRVFRRGGRIHAEVWVTEQDGLKLVNGQSARVYNAEPPTGDVGAVTVRTLVVPIQRLVNRQQTPVSEQGVYSLDLAAFPG